MTILLSCQNCGYESEYDDEEDAQNNGWWADETGDWYCGDCHAECGFCREEVPTNECTYSEYYDCDICDRCAGEMSRCSSCDELFTGNDLTPVRVMTSSNSSHMEDWCPVCFRRAREAGRVQEVSGVWVISNERVDGHIYQPDLHPEVWKEISDCKECNEYRGCYPHHNCPKCMRKMAKELELEETTLWVYDTRAMSYHNSDHYKFKTTKYREEHEHPHLFYGIELEVLFNDNTPIQQITKEFIIATGGLFVAEYDRSVTDRGNGIEFISRPLSYKKWTSEEVYQRLKAGNTVLKKYHAYDPQGIYCGLHVHMSLKFFEENTEKSVKDIKSDMDWIFQVFQPEIEKLSRRKYTKYCASKAFRLKEVMKNIRGGYGFNINSTMNIEKGDLTISMGSGDTHHDAVIQTEHTIEVRTFGSTIRPEEIIAVIEFCRAVAHAARNHKLTTKTTFGDIIFCKDSKYLPDYARRLKVDTNVKFANKLEVKV